MVFVLLLNKITDSRVFPGGCWGSNLSGRSNMLLCRWGSTMLCLPLQMRSCTAPSAQRHTIPAGQRHVWPDPLACCELSCCWELRQEQIVRDAFLVKPLGSFSGLSRTNPRISHKIVGDPSKSPSFANARPPMYQIIWTKCFSFYITCSPR